MSFFDTLFGPPDLKALKEKGDIDGLIRALGYLKDSKIRLDAARTLGDFRDGKATKKLIQVLEDSDPQVVRAAVTSLGRIGDEQALDPLKSMVDEEIKKEEPESILLGLAFHSIKQVGGIEYLIDSYQSTNEYIRFLSLKELSDIKDPRLFQLFANELNGNSWLSSSHAVDGLANLGDIRAIPYLVPALRQQKEVRWKAANALLGFGEKDILIQNLQDRSGDKDGEFRLEIAGCLAGSRDPECISAILPLLKEHDNQVSTRIALGIQLDDQSRLIDILKEILLDRENSDEVHWIATERLGKIDDRSAADILFSTFEYYPQDSGIHWRTIKSFESRKDPHLIESLIRFLENAEARMADMDKGRISALRSQLQVIDHQLHEISTQISSKLPALKLENGEYIEDKMKKLGIKPDPEVLSLRNSMAPLAAEKFKIEQEISRLSRAKSNPVFFSYGAEDTALKLLQSLTHQGFIKSEDWRRWKESS